MSVQIPALTLPNAAPVTRTRDRLDTGPTKITGYPYYLRVADDGNRLRIVPVDATGPLQFAGVLGHHAYPSVVANNSRQMEFESEQLILDLFYFGGVDPAAPTNAGNTLIGALALQPSSDAFLTLLDDVYAAATSGGGSGNAGDLMPWSQYTGLPATLPSTKWLIASVSGLNLLNGTPTNTNFSTADSFPKWCYGFTMVFYTVMPGPLPPPANATGFLESSSPLASGYVIVARDGAGTPVGDVTQALRCNADMDSLPGTVERTSWEDTSGNFQTKTVVKVDLRHSPIYLGINGAADERALAFSNGDSLTPGINPGLGPLMLLESGIITDIVSGFGTGGY